MRKPRHALAFLYQASITARREGFRLLDVTVWPLIMFFSMTLFVRAFSNDSAVLALVVLGTLGWRVLYHVQIEPVQLYMETYWSGMLEHIMVTGVRWRDYLLAGVASGLVKSLFLGVIFLGLGTLVFGVTVADWAGTLLALGAIALCGAILAIIGIGVGFLKGSDAFAVLFALPDIMAVGSGVYYPISVFPEPLRVAVQLFPTTHAFSLLKGTLGMAEGSWTLFALTAVLWLLMAVLFVEWAYRRTLRQGKFVRNK